MAREEKVWEYVANAGFTPLDAGASSSKARRET